MRSVPESCGFWSSPRRRPKKMAAAESIDFSPDDDLDIDVEPVRVLPEPEPKHENSLASMGMAALTGVVCLCLLVLGIPMLLIFFLKSPDLLQKVPVLGLSYQQLVCAFLLSATIIAYICIFFLRLGPVAILAFFALSVFSCFPLVVGLKNNLTLAQAIVETPFFQNWPFFLRPGYILIEFLFPSAIMACLLLQVISILTKKSYRYIFLLVVLYLGLAAAFGFSALTQAGQPNLVNALSWIKGSRDQQPPVRRADSQPPPAQDVIGEPIPKMTLSPAAGAGKIETATPSETGTELDRKVQILSNKVDRILEVLTLSESRSSSPKISPSPADREALKDHGTKLRPTPATGDDLVMGKLVVEDLNAKVQTLSDKVEQILENLSQMAQEKEKLSVEPGTVPGGAVGKSKPVSQLGPKSSKSPDTEGQALKNLGQRVQVLSGKMDRVMETMAKVEGLLLEAGKSSRQADR